ncbi:hypothetical protein [Carboxydothermus pertinax]|nr:hypothetical protein [Carboxydothermus pertinax]
MIIFYQKCFKRIIVVEGSGNQQTLAKYHGVLVKKDKHNTSKHETPC